MVVVLLLLALFFFSMPAWAQSPPACVPARQQVNVLGVNGADIPIGATAQGVLATSTVRCQAMLKNNGTAPMRCRPAAQGAPTATNGLLFNAGDQLIMTTAGREAWNCIRTTGVSTTATTIEEVP
jgi:hypothetical protein